jgi:hypothetical protein
MQSKTRRADLIIYTESGRVMRKARSQRKNFSSCPTTTILDNVDVLLGSGLWLVEDQCSES